MQQFLGISIYGSSPILYQPSLPIHMLSNVSYISMMLMMTKVHYVFFPDPTVEFLTYIQRQT